MKKADLKKLISAIGKEKKAYHFSDSDYAYLSNGYFIIRTDATWGQYIVDQVNERKRKPNWVELESLKKFYENINGEICENISLETLSTGVDILKLEQDNYSVWINPNYKIEGGTFYTSGRMKPVYEFTHELWNSDAVLVILPINHREE